MSCAFSEAHVVSADSILLVAEMQCGPLPVTIRNLHLGTDGIGMQETKLLAWSHRAAEAGRAGVPASLWP